MKPSFGLYYSLAFLSVLGFFLGVITTHFPPPVPGNGTNRVFACFGIAILMPMLVGVAGSLADSIVYGGAFWRERSHFADMTFVEPGWVDLGEVQIGPHDAFVGRIYPKSISRWERRIVFKLTRVGGPEGAGFASEKWLETFVPTTARRGKHRNIGIHAATEIVDSELDEGFYRVEACLNGRVTGQTVWCVDVGAGFALIRVMRARGETFLNTDRARDA